ncbi:MutS-related protein [Flagellimonas meridianipacifica]|uniref:MutS-like protein n=1 Tax=Flagellimonas meridianipacifica TaxID=1080225 RepID=A0A2T0MCK8_9FLAO|nr:DNA mismatch repair protein MutS [Allomuricauda pacifica]PRX55226.1 MutS-like protein [Allomuricauda pacifica]
MKDPRPFYENEIAKLKDTLVKQKQVLTQISLMRLLVFVGTCALLYLFSKNAIWMWTSFVFGAGLFLFLLRSHADKRTIFELNKELKRINEEEIEVLKGNYLDRFDGKVFEEPSHFFSSDIDLFGRGSFFQYANRTGLKKGTDYLCNMLLSNSIDNIHRKQEAIQELSTMPKWVQRYTALGRLTKTELSSKTIINWLQTYVPFIPDKLKRVPAIFGFISVVFFTLVVLKIVNWWFLGIWFLLGLVFSGFFLKRNNELNAKTSKVKDTIEQYSLLLQEIENQNFRTDLLLTERKKIESGQEKASIIFKRFSNAMDRFDNRNNVFVALLGNGFFLWDLQSAYQIEQWIVKYNHLVGQWFATIAFFDAYNSFGTFAFNHSEFTFPTIEKDTDYLIQAKSLGHPLIETEKRINSDLRLGKDDFFVVTGANMAGKSTFLRTASLYVLMSNLGLPVCAEESAYVPIKLITSMRTTDSLADQSSYFFSELTRLQFIMEQLEQDTYLVILDEILKGTNSVDKAQGSKRLIERLVERGVPGIIATHDLSLCEIASSLKEVKNYFFETEIKDDELHFDYQLKEGVCKNMNASFLLKKMKIVE